MGSTDTDTIEYKIITTMMTRPPDNRKYFARSPVADLVVWDVWGWVWGYSHSIASQWVPISAFRHMWSISYWVIWLVSKRLHPTSANPTGTRWQLPLEKLSLRRATKIEVVNETVWLLFGQYPVTHCESSTHFPSMPTWLPNPQSLTQAPTSFRAM